jgi:alkylhydroperoxidase family enzyme
VAARLESMMPPGVPPILLFRTLVRNLPMTEAMSTWGSYELSKQLSLSMRDREIIIDRTCALCHCEYEWGVHIDYFAQRVGFSVEQITSLTHGGPSDTCWENERDRVLIEAVDSLCATAQIKDALWESITQHFTENEILDLLMLTGWYHAICFTANVIHIDLEDGAPRFDDVR